MGTPVGLTTRPRTVSPAALIANTSVTGGDVPRTGNGSSGPQPRRRRELASSDGIDRRLCCSESSPQVHFARYSGTHGMLRPFPNVLLMVLSITRLLQRRRPSQRLARLAVSLPSGCPQFAPRLALSMRMRGRGASPAPTGSAVSTGRGSSSTASAAFSADARPATGFPAQARPASAQGNNEHSRNLMTHHCNSAALSKIARTSGTIGKYENGCP